MSLMSDEAFQPVGPFKTVDEARAYLRSLPTPPPAKPNASGKQGSGPTTAPDKRKRSGKRAAAATRR